MRAAGRHRAPGDADLPALEIRELLHGAVSRHHEPPSAFELGMKMNSLPSAHWRATQIQSETITSASPLMKIHRRISSHTLDLQMKDVGLVEPVVLDGVEFTVDGNEFEYRLAGHLAWLGRCRRLARDWGKSIPSAEAWGIIAHIRRVTRHLART